MLFASVSSRPFWAVLSTLLTLAALLNACAALHFRDRLAAGHVTRWDEAAIHAMLGRAAHMLAAQAAT